MFVVFGSKTTRKVVGEKQNWCAICRNTKTGYIKTTTWFTLFFIPIFPYSFKYSKICTNCCHEESITKKQFTDELAAPDILPPSPFSDDVFESAENAESAASAEKEREITVIRQKKAAGAFLKVAIYFGNREIGRLKNGESAKFTVENKEAGLHAMCAADGTISSNVILLKPSNTNNTFYVAFRNGKLVLADNDQFIDKQRVY